VHAIVAIYETESVWGNRVLSSAPEVLSTHDLLDIELHCVVSNASKVTITIRGEPLTYDEDSTTLNLLGKSAPLPLNEGRLKLRVLVDRTSIEVFAGDGQVSMTSSFTPDVANTQTTLSGSDVTVSTLTVHELRSTWE
jgi:sucrose-6-phosphate hydrolase SacC (GH32 family)